jgi:membrane associated rhomboid family serine protease
MRLVFGIEKEFDLDFTPYGILPRDFVGLRGIFFSVFIHGDFNHLVNNTLPILILGGSLFYFYKEVALRVFLISLFSSALYTWISARTSYHIGASGLVYALFGFLLISGFIRRNNSLIAISFLVAFIYGSLVWGILPWKRGISWEGHFWGLFIGLVLAFFYKDEGPKRPVYSWEEEEDVKDNDPFDTNGINLDNTHSNKNQVIVYHYKPKEKD